MKRRDFFLVSLALLLTPWLPRASGATPAALDWQAFLAAMRELASQEYDDPNLVRTRGERGVRLLQQLDIEDTGFRHAVDSSWESGNRFWLWQRLSRERGLNGGILTIEHGHEVPLHDHPQSTGMLRILSGEAEIWQFDRLAGAEGEEEGAGRVVLQCVSHRVLQPGDTAVLYPRAGNIHALRALSRECRMLDYFIPPYVRSQRTWYEPLAGGWRSQQRIQCLALPEQVFHTA
jgi:quercetin dioxygenase-like cupin family protein